MSRAVGSFYGRKDRGISDEAIRYSEIMIDIQAAAQKYVLSKAKDKHDCALLLDALGLHRRIE